MKNNRYYKKFYTIVATMFLLLLVVFMGLNRFLPDQSFSEEENRYLTERPKFSAAGFLDGRFEERYESYETDQFAFRPFWVSVKTSLEYRMGKTCFQGIYVGSNQYLLEDLVEPEEQRLSSTLGAMKIFAAQYPDTKFYMLLAPDAANVLKEYLPRFAPVADQNLYMNQVCATLEPEINWVEVREALSDDSVNPLYYHTDHHWTTQGAYDAFLEYASAAGFDTASREYESVPVTNEFRGTLASRSGYDTNYRDTIRIYLPKEEFDYVVTYVEEKKKTATFYEEEALEGKDKYQVFFGGNHPLIHISAKADPKRRLLVIKDSYANCFVPFLVPDYGEIVMVDPRYYTGDITELMEEYRFTEVLFLYNANTFFQDNSLAGMLGAEPS